MKWNPYRGMRPTGLSRSIRSGQAQSIREAAREWEKSPDYGGPDPGWGSLVAPAIAIGALLWLIFL